MANSYAHGLGLGLGLPSSFTSAGRTFSSKTIVVPNQTTFDFEGDCFYPLPSQSRRVTLQKEEVCQSYWSPDCSEMGDSESESEHAFSQDEEASPAGSSYLGTPADVADGLSPLQLAAHACLHLLSPRGTKGPAEDALANVQEWAWLVPAIGEQASGCELPASAADNSAYSSQTPASLNSPRRDSPPSRSLRRSKLPS